MAKSGMIIKLSQNMKPYIARVHRHGAIQMAFADQIGHPVGACVKGAVRRGMSQAAIREAVKECGQSKEGVKLNVEAYRNLRRAGGRPGRGGFLAG